MPTMRPIRINFLPVHSNEKMPPSIKNGRRNLAVMMHNQTQSIKNSSNAFSLGIASYILARFTLKDSSSNLMMKRWKTL